MNYSNDNVYFLGTVNDRDEGLGPRTYLLNKKRTIFLNSAVDEESAFVVASSIDFLADKSSEDIILYVNSPGGCVSDGLAILDAMQSSDCDIVTIATGMAASMGAFLLAAGTKGKRYATPSAKILLHQPLGGAQGQASDIIIAAENIQKTKTQLTASLAEFTGQTPDKINADIDRNLWLSAEEALAYGIIDHIGKHR
jgi:ATP-dependent Clp protease protease subunit